MARPRKPKSPPKQKIEEVLSDQFITDNSENLTEQQIFGFQLGQDDPSDQTLHPDPRRITKKSFALPQNDDGAMVVAGAGFQGTWIDLDGTFRNETQLITKYREMSIQPEMETALAEITNEAIVEDEDGTVVELNTDKIKATKNIQQRIRDEFEGVLKLLDF